MIIQEKKKNSHIILNILLLSSSFSALARVSYDPDLISSMPEQADSFIAKFNRSSSQLYGYSRTPGMGRSIRALNNYYQLQYENFMSVFQQNLNTIGVVSDLVSDAKSTPGVGSCLEGSSRKNTWGEFVDSLESMDGLSSYVNKSIQSQQGSMSAFTQYGSGFFERRGMPSDVASSYKRVAKYVDPSKKNSGLLNDLRECCKKTNSQAEVCNESTVKDRLASLADLKPLPTRFVDPLNPGALVQNMNPDDLMTMVGLGQMNDFAYATDFNVQAAALANADQKCQDNREAALRKMGHTAQQKGLARTVVHTLHCSLWSVAQNWGKGARTFVTGATRSTFPLFDTISQCPPEVQQQATLALMYSPEQFQNDFRTLGRLPGNIVYSSPVASAPITIRSLSDSSAQISFVDDAGFVQSSMLLTADTQTKNLASQSKLPVVVGATNAAANNEATRNGVSVMRGLQGKRVVKGMGETLAKQERLAVRSLASKTAEGNLEAARTLAGSVKGRATEVKATVERMKADSGLASRSASRALASRQLVAEGTAVHTSKGVSEIFKGAYRGLFRQMSGDSSTSSSSGRTVERATTTNAATGTSSVSTNGTFTDKQNQINYQQEQKARDAAVLLSSLNSLGTSINGIATRLNDIIKQKQAAIENYKLAFEPSKLYSELGNLGADARANRLISLTKEWANTVKEINILNTQELGLRISINTAKSSMQNMIAGAQAFQGLKVQMGDIRGPASVPNSLPNMTNGMSVNGLLPNDPSLNPKGVNPFFVNGQPPISIFPPNFKFTPGFSVLDDKSIYSKMLNLFILPSAFAAPVSLDQQREKLYGEWSNFMDEYSRYQDKLAVEDSTLKQKMWDRFLFNEKQNRAENYISTEGQIVVGSFGQAIREELPDLLAYKNNQALSSAVNPQVGQYIEEIRRGSEELDIALAEEARLKLKSRATDPDLDEASWTGLLPGMALGN
ncbi:MAG: hypothetical protein WCK43_04895 [bacterium]